ncbi:MAG TPA: thioesterase family protein [Caldimonas sp.]|jgi:acyl-CoA thioesterase|nr:thioesterase family protein [Caldimonas sp.]HEX2542648.1 thioesterase family protein [Caldimonas sp.]
MHPLDLATALHGAAADAVRTARTSDAYWTFISPFGGVSAAAALRAVLERPDREGDPLALTVNFCAPITRGEFAVHTRRARANRSSQHWQVEFTQGASGDPVLTASIVTAARCDTWSHRVSTPPVLPPWETTPPFPTRGSLSWVAQYEFRFAEGSLALSDTVPEPPHSPRSVLWLRDAEPRPLDFLSLAAMSDAFFGRIFQVIGRFPPFGTISMTTYFHASATELAEHGTAPLAAVADAHVFHRSFCDQTAELYGAAGQLLATTSQVAYFKV